MIRVAELLIIDNCTGYRGTDQEYLLRRIQTEAPELIPDIGKGKKYKSARSAAIAGA